MLEVSATVARRKQVRGLLLGDHVPLTLVVRLSPARLSSRRRRPLSLLCVAGERALESAVVAPSTAAQR